MLDVENRTLIKRIPQQERSQARFEAVLEAALHLFASRGYENTSMREIAREEMLPLESGVRNRSTPSVRLPIARRASLAIPSLEPLRPFRRRARRSRRGQRCPRAGPGVRRLGRGGASTGARRRAGTGDDSQHEDGHEPEPPSRVLAHRGEAQHNPIGVSSPRRCDARARTDGTEALGMSRPPKVERCPAPDPRRQADFRVDHAPPTDSGQPRRLGTSGKARVRLGHRSAAPSVQ